MRRSGRTTRILLKMALYISEHAEEPKVVLFKAYNVSYAHDLIIKLQSMLPDLKKINSNHFTFMKTHIFIASSIVSKELLLHSDIIFEDHYCGEGWIIGGLGLG